MVGDPCSSSLQRRMGGHRRFWGSDISFCKVFIDEFVHFHVFLGCQRVDSAIFWYKVCLEINSVVPGSWFEESFGFLWHRGSPWVPRVSFLWGFLSSVFLASFWPSSWATPVLTFIHNSSSFVFCSCSIVRLLLGFLYLSPWGLFFLECLLDLSFPVFSHSSHYSFLVGQFCQLHSSSFPINLGIVFLEPW